MEEMSNTIQALKKEVIVLNTKYENLQSSLKGKKSKIADLKHKFGGKDSKIADLKQETAKKEELIRILQGKISAKEAKIHDFEKTGFEKDSKINDMKRRILEKDAKITKNEKVNQEKDTKIAGLRVTILEKDRAIDSLEGNIVGQKANIANLEGKIVGKEARITNLQRNMEGKDQTISNLEKKLVDQKRSITKYQNTIKTQKATIVDLEKKMSHLRLGVKLIIHYNASDFKPDMSRPEIQCKGVYPWSRPFIKCQIPTLGAGMTRYIDLREALKPLFNNEIRGIKQHRTTVNDITVAQVTQLATDENVRTGDPSTEFCSEDGRQWSFDEVRKPSSSFVGGSRLLICGGGRRTSFRILSS